MKTLRDGYKRIIDYMRVSITDRCNLRCIYCMPPEGLRPIRHKEILRYEEILRVARVAVKVGVRRIRITGGEPLVRRDVSHLIAQLSAIEDLQDLSLTTNGILLEDHAEELARAGLSRVNVSLDSLRPERYREITRGGDLGAVLRGIDAARKAGLEPIKINMVPVRGINDDEIADFSRLTLELPYQIRFIEFMPFGSRELWSPERFISSDEMRSLVEKIAPLQPAGHDREGPARYFKLEGAAGMLGFISPLSNHFCAECSRLRLTADGKLRPCLFSETEIDLKPALRSGAGDSEIERMIKLSAEIKPKGHEIRIQDPGLRKLMQARNKTLKPMSQIGG
ncbi:MAG TPA: GTP 3',8-cyclase MoaA [Thermodesulfovibrionales bacterium]|nr:GTP 3',8-cyclase MoaA [Thermodesulfovibrionales bacterium]